MLKKPNAAQPLGCINSVSVDGADGILVCSSVHTFSHSIKDASIFVMYSSNVRTVE